MRFHRAVDPRQAGVSSTSMLRASSGLGMRRTNPLASSRCRRCVIVPEVTINAENNAVGARQ